MFDLITGKAGHIPSKPGVPLLFSIASQLSLVMAILLPVLFFAGTLPEVPTMVAFVAAAPAPPPPPPPPPPPQAVKPVTPAQTQRVAAADVAPTAAPAAIEPERVAEASEPGVPGGVEGGVPGGIAGGIVGGLPNEIPPPPPPPPPPPVAIKAPVRVGGNIQAPALARRVEPVYPDVAVSARMRGVVILEANVDADGHVVEVKVLRSANRLLDTAAITAVRQWQYRPLILNGLPEPFVLTVVLTFNLVDS
jgi:protein TonB